MSRPIIIIIAIMLCIAVDTCCDAIHCSSFPPIHTACNRLFGTAARWYAIISCDCCFFVWFLWFLSFPNVPSSLRWHLFSFLSFIFFYSLLCSFNQSHWIIPHSFTQPTRTSRFNCSRRLPIIIICSFFLSFCSHSLHFLRRDDRIFPLSNELNSAIESIVPNLYWVYQMVGSRCVHVQCVRTRKK